MRYKLIVIFDVLIDIYVTAFLYACSDKTSMLGRMWGICVGM
jgi:hypothetical protein